MTRRSAVPGVFIVTLALVFLTAPATTALPTPAWSDAPGASGGTGLVGGLAQAQAAAEEQASQLGVGLPTLSPSEAEHPSEPILALYHHLGLQPTPSQAREIRALDDLPVEQATALALTADAFLDLEIASRPLAHASAESPPEPGTLAHVLAARMIFLDTLPSLEQAFQSTSAAPTIDQAPVIALDLVCSDTTYTDDYVLIVDVCGNDVYANNAGGTIDFRTNTIPPTSDPGCSGDPAPGESFSVSAAVVDLAGDDAYGVATRGCGVNGGGILGSGTLVDVTGTDTYDAANVAVNGGGHFGAGFLLDVGTGASDTYTANGQGANGGGFVAGVGTLVDADGGATYTVDGTSTQRAQATNGGGFLAGVGLLIDGPLGTAAFSGDTDEWSTETCALGACLDAPLPEDDGVGLRIS